MGSERDTRAMVVGKWISEDEKVQERWFEGSSLAAAAVAGWLEVVSLELTTDGVVTIGPGERLATPESVAGIRAAGGKSTVCAAVFCVHDSTHTEIVVRTDLV
jgi:hypothetical protein